MLPFLVVLVCWLSIYIIYNSQSSLIQSRDDRIPITMVLSSSDLLICIRKNLSRKAPYLAQILKYTFLARYVLQDCILLQGTLKKWIITLNIIICSRTARDADGEWISICHSQYFILQFLFNSILSIYLKYRETEEYKYVYRRERERLRKKETTPPWVLISR